TRVPVRTRWLAPEPTANSTGIHGRLAARCSRSTRTPSSQTKAAGSSAIGTSSKPMFAINPTDPAPIWRQIEEVVRRLIALGALQSGAPVPSVRDLAKDLRVNPNTVA